MRRLWDQGCDVRIITTLAGRGVNQTLKNGRGRGAVPIRRVTIDRNGDRVPERYLHMKAISIHGGFGDDPSADVLITGSPNWSSRAQRSDEIVFRFLEVPALARQYAAHVDRLFGGPYSHRRTVGGVLRPGAEVDGGEAADGDRVGRRPATPAWYELD